MFARDRRNLKTVANLELEVDRLLERNRQQSSHLKSLYPAHEEQEQQTTTVHATLDHLITSNNPQSLLQLENYLESLKVQIVRGDPQNFFHVLEDHREHQEILNRIHMEEREEESIFTTISRAFFGSNPPVAHADVTCLEPGWYIKLPQSSGVKQQAQLKKAFGDKIQLGTPVDDPLTLVQLNRHLNDRFQELKKLKEQDEELKEQDEKENQQGSEEQEFNFCYLWELLDKENVDGQSKIGWNDFVKQTWSECCNMEKRTFDNTSVPDIKANAVSQFHVINEYELDMFVDHEYIDLEQEHLNQLTLESVSKQQNEKQEMYDAMNKDCTAKERENWAKLEKVDPAVDSTALEQERKEETVENTVNTETSQATNDTQEHQTKPRPPNSIGWAECLHRSQNYYINDFESKNSKGNPQISLCFFCVDGTCMHIFVLCCVVLRV